MTHRICLFAYDFPHRKSTEVFGRLILERFDVVAVIAAPWVKLKTRPPSKVRSKPNRIPTITAQAICEDFGIPYHVAPHNDESVGEIVSDAGATVGVVGGARILKEPTLSAFPSGIINLHPGLIPEARGLDALKWSIYHDLPPGVTAHLIDERIDAGRVLIRRQIEVFPDDTLLDVGLRIDDTQLEVLPEALHQLESQPEPESYPVIGDVGATFGAMKQEIEAEVQTRFGRWRQTWSGIH